MLIRVLAAGALLIGTASVARAGVAGFSFEGTLTNRGGEQGSLCLVFDDDSREFILERQFRDDLSPVAFEGAFVETDLLLFSFFNGELGGRAITGFQVLGFVSLSIIGPNRSLLAQGAAFVSECRPSGLSAPIAVPIAVTAEPPAKLPERADAFARTPAPQATEQRSRLAR